MDEAPLDRLNALTIVYDAMTNLGAEVNISQFHEFEVEIHLAVSRLKKAGMWMRQIIPLVAPSVGVLERMSYVAKGLETQGSSTQPPGLRTLSKESTALAAIVDAYTSDETIVFSDEMHKLPETEESSSSHKTK